MTPSSQAVIGAIRVGFETTPHPGDGFLVGSHDGCEPAEVIAPLRGVTDWSQVPVDVLDAQSEALSFLSEGGFRFFLPAYLVADVEGRLSSADPVFPLTNGFSDTVVRLPTGTGFYEKTIGRSALLNPRRYGAIAFLDYARYRLSVFAREEVEAIVIYLEHRRDTDPGGPAASQIAAALDAFWRQRARDAPTQAMLQRHLADEAAYLHELESS